jgi:CRP/FNR family cyclic AMP-dependent transcriptional regulator
MISVVPGKILEVYNDGENRIGLVEFDGKRRPIYLSLVPGAEVGDYVIFRAGFATDLVEVNEAEIAPAEAHRVTRKEPWQPEPDVCDPPHLLSKLDPAQLRKLIPLAEDKPFEAGDIIFHAGDRSLFLHLITAGKVALEEVSGALPVQVQTLHTGDAMGWSAFTAEARTHFQARALSRGSTVAFAGDQLRAVCDEDPAIGYALMKRLMELVTDRLDAMRIKLAERSLKMHG